MVVRLLCKESVAGSTPAKGAKAFFDVLKIVAVIRKNRITQITTMLQSLLRMSAKRSNFAAHYEI